MFLIYCQECGFMEWMLLRSTVLIMAFVLMLRFSSSLRVGVWIESINNHQGEQEKRENVSERRE